MTNWNGTHPDGCPCEWCEDLNASVSRHPSNTVPVPVERSVTEPEPDWRWFCIAVAVFAVICSLLILFMPNKAEATPARWQQPYGGCKEAWQAPQSAGADECRAHGWVISSRLVVGPHRVVRYSSLPECANEDRGRSCSWNFDSTYADNGRAYWFGPKGRIHYAWPLAEVRTWPRGWEWVNRELADALAEGASAGATRRHWGRCNVVWGDTTVITCPDWFQVVS